MANIFRRIVSGVQERRITRLMARNIRKPTKRRTRAIRRYHARRGVHYR